MSKEKKERLPTYRTPAGIARYPWLNKPDVKFKKEGEYRIQLLLGGKDAETMKEFVDKAMADSLAKAKADPKNKGKKIKQADAPYKPATDDDGEETGQTRFSFKMKASGERKDGSKWQRRPGIFDAKGKPVLNANVGGGTKLKVAYQIVPFFTPLVGAGVRLGLEAVQIIDLVEWSSSRDAGDYGFEQEEGYSSEGAAPDRSGEEESGNNPPDADGSEEF